MYLSHRHFLVRSFCCIPHLRDISVKFFSGSGNAPGICRSVALHTSAGQSGFLAALLNTAFLGIIFLLIIIPLSLVMASLLNNLRVWPNFFKAIYFLPQITSTVAVALVFSYVFQPNWGLVNGLLRELGVDPLPLWLAEPRYVLTGSRAAVTILAVWVASGILHAHFPGGVAGRTR